MLNRTFILCIAYLLALSSCVTHGEIVNFNEGQPFEQLKGVIGQLPNVTIQVDDLLSIQVKSQSEKAAQPFNLEPTTASGGNITRERTSPYDYLVAPDGYIPFPVLGPIKVAGLTVTEARELIESRLKTGDYITDPIVLIRFTNYKVTFLGEVNIPGTIVFPEERVTLLEALGQAGDITDYGNRRRILVIREVDGAREYGYVNLHSRDIVNSPYFYLRQNDVIYVEPMKEKTATLSDFSRRVLPWVSLGTSLLTLGIALTR